jgi:hypothetical protein
VSSEKGEFSETSGHIIRIELDVRSRNMLVCLLPLNSNNIRILFKRVELRARGGELLRQCRIEILTKDIRVSSLTLFIRVLLPRCFSCYSS